MNRIKELCELHNISQNRLAKDICVSQPSVNTWCLNKHDPSGKNLKKCARYFGVSTNCILCLEELPAQSTEVSSSESQQDAPENAGTPSLSSPEPDSSESNTPTSPRDNTHEVAVASLQGLTHDELLQVIGFIAVVKASRTR